MFAHVPRFGSYGSPADQAVVLFKSVPPGGGSVIGADAVILLLGGRAGHIVDEVSVYVHPAALLMMRSRRIEFLHGRHLCPFSPRRVCRVVLLVVGVGTVGSVIQFREVHVVDHHPDVMHAGFLEAAQSMLGHPFAADAGTSH